MDSKAKRLGRRLGWLGCWSLVAMAGACGGEQKNEAETGKAAFETAIADLKEPVGAIAAFLPYLQRPEDKGEYVPVRRADEVKASFYAANEIRHAANRARQKGDRSTSAVTKELAPAFDKLNKACTNPEDMEAVAKCEAEVKVLDAALQAQATKASAAGASGTFPRVVPEAVTDAAKAALANFKKAIGPTDAESAYLKKRADKAVAAQTLISECQAAATEADNVMKEFQRVGDPELSKLAAIHKLALDSQCNKLTTADGLMSGLEQCHPDKRKKAPAPPPGEEGADECARVCAQSKTMLSKGIPAAAFEKFPEHFDAACEQDGKVKDK